jgi:hypothetical protein
VTNAAFAAYGAVLAAWIFLALGVAVGWWQRGRWEAKNHAAAQPDADIDGPAVDDTDPDAPALGTRVRIVEAARLRHLGEVVAAEQQRSRPRHATEVTA